VEPRFLAANGRQREAARGAENRPDFLSRPENGGVNAAWFLRSGNRLTHNEPVSVAEHLGIRLDDYDAKIRTFIPDYEEMIEAGAATLRALERPAPRLLDLGIGTGAFAAACARVAPDVRVTGIDADSGILDMARSRLEPLGITATLLHGNFTDVTLPACDVIVSSFALHHIKVAGEKQELFRTLHQVIATGGLLVLVDHHPSADSVMARLNRDAWRAHLQRSYSESEADGLLATWAGEDTYVALPEEMAMIRVAGFTPHVAWRRNGFAVLAARA
jgi:ubiquinone/menaquinone biosynthesis C-methylase UbiE